MEGRRDGWMGGWVDGWMFVHTYYLHIYMHVTYTYIVCFDEAFLLYVLCFSS